MLRQPLLDGSIQYLVIFRQLTRLTPLITHANLRHVM